MTESFPLFLAAQPGLEDALADEARAAGFDTPSVTPGGVETRGDFAEMMRANLVLSGAGRVLVRITAFRAFHLAQLDKRARKVDWGAWLPPGTPVRIEASCRKSKIYHDRAAAQRVAKAAGQAGLIPATGEARDAVRLVTRIEDDLVTLSLDTSGAPLHRRGLKEFVGKAPLRETMAALFLRQAGYDGQMPLVDPMCGSGTILLEGAAVAAGVHPGRARNFAFERFTQFEPNAWQALRGSADPALGSTRLYGYDRDQGAIQGARQNAARAGVDTLCQFTCQPVSGLIPPVDGPGLVMVNPPYGARIGNKKLLFGLYGALGQVLRERFADWRVGIITSDAGLARATGLPLAAGPRIAHGGLTVQLWQTSH
ncbi:THUMP domain-containing class I SAM-dependent RNA methyltransferase [Tropicimonas sp. S265A]|uniref:THUMP domain-containing class I SAM-dependent RNA methyltransferase n=1 Tax=Tropicimonas sp. S265A TaxID=3415134 RepID=UPI003C7B2FE8